MDIIIIILIIIWGGGRGSIRALNEHKNLHFDDTKAIHVCSEMYEANGYMHNLDLLSFHSNHVFHILG